MFHLGIHWTLSVILLTFLEISFGNNNQFCDRSPLGTKAAPLPPDDRFQISIDGIIDDKYIPRQTYTVTLFSRDYEAKFIAFTISAAGATKENPKNALKPFTLESGEIYSSPDTDNVKYSENCKNTVIQSNVIPKSSVQVTWVAPRKDQGCVTIYALVAVKADVWYNKEGPLIKEICEDQRQKDDMQPSLNPHCTLCDEAKYLITFKGTWTYNTHYPAYPKNPDVAARFSDLVGASHKDHFQLWKSNKEATPGLKMLAEQGYTTKLEMEILEKYGNGVRTIIKAKGQPDPNTPTYSIFRANREYHRISLVSAILPSPDWFLGIADLELCNTDSWASNITLNLYPLDAGTDSGKDFESPNDETSPPKPISRAVFIDGDKINGGNNKIKAFARLRVELVRTYEQPDCLDTNVNTGNNEANSNTGTSTESESPIEPSSEEIHSINTHTSPVPPEECPLTEWEDWLPCSGVCLDGKLQGFQTRVRYHLVDDVAVDKYDENTSMQINKEVPENCRNNYPVSETRECEDTCDVRETERGHRKSISLGESGLKDEEVDPIS